MRSGRRQVLLIGAIILFLVVVGILVRPGPPRPEPEPERPLSILFNATVEAQDEEGRTILLISFKRGEQWRNGRYKVIGVDRAFIYRDGEPVVSLSADEAVYDENTRNASLSGKVKLTSKDGFTLEMQDVKFEYRTRRITTEKPLVVSQGTMRGKAPSATYYLTEQKLVCPGPIRGTLGRGSSFKASKLVYDGKTKRLHVFKIKALIMVQHLRRATPQQRRR